MAMVDVREEQLKKMFTADAADWQPPLVREYGLQQQVQAKEQRRLLMAVSVLSCIWWLLALLATVVLLEQAWIWGVRLSFILLITLLSVGLLTVAILRTEQPLKYKKM